MAIAEPAARAGALKPVKVDVERFEDQGYLLIDDIFDPVRDLDPVVAEYAAQLDQVATEWHAKGIVESTYADLPFAERFAHILNDAGPEGRQGREAHRLSVDSRPARRA